jgi:hypothetical protein
MSNKEINISEKKDKSSKMNNYENSYACGLCAPAHACNNAIIFSSDNSSRELAYI